jgi:hypothetical protein
MNDFGSLRGVVAIVCGIYGLLLAQGFLPRNPKDPERMRVWRRKFGGVMSVLCPIIVLYGIAQVFGVLR